MSLILKALDHDPRHVLISMLCALSVAETMEKLAGVTVQVKWPNDLWVEGRKVCGILIEAGPAGRMVVAGMGINLFQEERDFPAELRTTAASLYQVSGTAVDREQFLMELLKHFEERYLGAGPETHDRIVEHYRSRSALIGREVTVNGEVRGRVVDVSRAGELVVETSRGTVALVDGVVRLAES
jgi:BirA family biotin operon repressor/biotin-[acetyl-CoA-carboxylase] ligase